MAAARNPSERSTKEVRKQAEQSVNRTRIDAAQMSAEEAERLLYELEVHQEELKIQNEELRRVQLELESACDRYTELYDFAPVGYVTVDPDGLIIHANLATATMLGQERSKIVGTSLKLYCDEDSRTELCDHLEKVLTSETSKRCALKFTTPKGATFDALLHTNRLAASDADVDWHCRVIITDISRDKAAEAILRASEERYRRLVANSPFCIHEVELNGKFSAVNPAGMAMSGLTDESEIVGFEYLSRVSEDDQPRIRRLFEQARNGQTTYFDVRSEQGQVFEACFIPLKDHVGNVQRIMGTAQDISKRRLAEKALQASERFFRTIFEQAAVGVAQVDSVSGVILRINRRYCEILSTPAKHLLGKTWMELTQPDDLAADLGNMQRLRAGEIREFSIEKRLKRKDGSYVWTNLTVSPMWQPGEEPSTHIAILEDITERLKSEAAVRLRDHAFASSSHGIVIVDATQEDLPIIYCNPAFQKMTGYTDEEILRHNCRFLQGEDRNQPARAAIRTALKRGEECSATLRNYRKDGTMFWCELRISPVRDANGRLTHFLGFQNDVTKRKNAESERLRLLDILQRSLNEIYVFDAKTLRFEYVNAGALRNLGYSLDTMHQMTLIDIKPEYTEEAFRDLVTLLRTGTQELLHFETLHQRADGSRYPVEVNLQLIRRENDEVFLAVVLDITERKRQEQQYRAIVETTQEWIWEVDTLGVHTYSNPAIETLLGYTVDEIVGGNALELMHELDQEFVVDQLPRLVTRKQGWTGWLLRWRHQDGSIRYLESNATPILNENDRLLGFRGCDRDVTDRVKADQLLRVSEERYRVMTENATEAIVVFDLDTGLFVDFNHNACRLFKTTSNQLRRMGPVDVSPVTQPNGASSESLAMQYVQRALDDQGTVQVFEWTHEDTEGQLIPCEVRIVVMPDPSKRLLRGAITDITERKRAEEALRESRERFRQLAENIDEVFWLTDLATHKVLYASPAYEKTWGRPVEALYADSLQWTNAIHPDDRDRVEKSILERATCGEWVEEYRIIRPDGTQRTIRDRAFPIRDESGTVVRLAGISEDVTERVQSQRALLDSEHRFRAIFEQAAIGVALLKTDSGVILQLNERYCRILGFPEEDLAGRTWMELTHPDDVAANLASRDEMLAGNIREFTMEKRIQRPDGSLVWINLTASPMWLPGEKPTTHIAIVQDITERKQAEEAVRRNEATLRELNASLEQRVAERTAELMETNAELTAFAHTVSHDLRAPLRAMEGFAAALAEDYGDRLDEGGHEFIKHIADSAKRMDSLVNDLLVFSRLGRKELQLKAIRLDSIFTEARRQLSSEIEACNAKMKIADQMPTVLGHKATLVQVVANLLSNAIKFVAEGVRPEIRAWSERRDNGMIRIWFEDNGIGVDDAYRDRIFRVFERLHGIESYPGTGIGLAIVARACERLGGRCGFESQPDQGSRFWVEFQEGDTNP